MDLQGASSCPLNNGARRPNFAGLRGSRFRLTYFTKTCRHHSYLWRQRCCWNESGRACRGPHRCLHCFCLRLGLSVLLSFRASWRNRRCKRLPGISGVGSIDPVDKTVRFWCRWTRIVVYSPGRTQNLPETGGAASGRRTRLSNRLALRDDVARQ